MTTNDHKTISDTEQKLREALRLLITPALLGLINEGDDEPAGMPNDAAVDVIGNGLKCQITVGDIRNAARLLDDLA